MPNFEHEMTYVKEMAKEHGTADRSGRSRSLRLEEDNRILIEAYRITNEVISFH